MTLETSAMTSAMVVVFVSGIVLVITSSMPVNITSMMVLSMDLVKVSGIIISTKILTK